VHIMTVRRAILVLCFALVSAAAHAQTTATQKPFEPKSGQPGKDVVWVPTPQALVDKMLDMARVTPQDYVIDLGSGDGRTVITAARRGSRALGIEYNPDMVDLSKKNALDAGVTGKATFVKADLFETDFSQANVITMFLLPTINMKLRPKILDLKPGTRIVSNSFNMEDWQPDETGTVTDGCETWCTAYLWIVPAKVAGTWTLPAGDLVLAQEFQMLSGTLAGAAIADAKMNGDEITFTVNGAKYTGKVSGKTMTGTIAGGPGGTWTATKK
jgi:SAM-dependent methyltransferase